MDKLIHFECQDDRQSYLAYTSLRQANRAYILISNMLCFAIAKLLRDNHPYDIGHFE